MLKLNCNKCAAELEVDEGFAGGVCRCQHCGSIQPVPKYLKKSVTKAPPLVGASSRGQMEAQGTGLDDLASAAASSGLSSGALKQKAPPLVQQQQRAAVAQALPRRKGGVRGFSFGFIFGILVGAGLAWYFLRTHTNLLGIEAQTNSVGSPSTPTKPVEEKPRENVGPPLVIDTKHPTYLGLALDVGKDKSPVVYVLDWDESQSRLVESMKKAMLRSLATLGPEAKFQVLYWGAAGKLEKFPAAGAANATPEKITACREQLEMVSPKGKTDSASALKTAMEKPSSQILFSTTKSTLEKPVADAVIAATAKKKAIRIDAFTVSASASNEVAKTIADKCNGSFMEVSEGQLIQFAK